MNGCDEMNQCQRAFEQINGKLDRLDEAVRGNSKPGIQLRLDRLEASERGRNRLLWLISGTLVTLVATALWKHLIGG